MGLFFVVGCSGKASSTDAAGGMDAGGTSGVPMAGTAGAAGIGHTGGVGGVAGAGGITPMGGIGGVAGGGIGHTGGVGGVTGTGGFGGFVPVDGDGCPLFVVQAEGHACVAPKKACGLPARCQGVNVPNFIVSGSVIYCSGGYWVRDHTEHTCTCDALELKNTPECNGDGAGGQGGESAGGAGGDAP